MENYKKREKPSSFGGLQTSGLGGTQRPTPSSPTLEGLGEASQRMLNWYALYTKPRREQKVAQQLEQLGFTIYLPLKVEIKQWSDRKKKVVSPLFSSYVFIQIEESKRAEAFVIDGVLNYVFWLGNPAVIRNSEMELMRNEIDKPNSDITVCSLQEGDLVQLQKGVFKGQSATIEHFSNQKVHLYLPSLGIKLVISRTAL